MNRIALATAALATMAPLTLMSTGAHAADDGAGRSAAGGSVAAADAPKRSVTIRVSTDANEVVADQDTVEVTGRVTPRRLLKGAKRKAVLQQRLEGRDRWRRTDKAKLRRNGKFSLQDDPSAPGTRYYRVLVPGGKGIKQSVSKELKVVVYRWEQLATWAPGPKLGLEVQTAVVGTRHYEGSLVSKTPGAPGSIEYTLGDRCVSLKATYAMTDASASGATGTAKLAVDGVDKVNLPLAIGAGTEVVTDVRDAFRVRFEVAGSTTPAGQAAAADVEVLCTK